MQRQSRVRSGMSSGAAAVVQQRRRAAEAARASVSQTAATVPMSQARSKRGRTVQDGDAHEDHTIVGGATDAEVACSLIRNTILCRCAGACGGPFPNSQPSNTGQTSDTQTTQD